MTLSVTNAFERAALGGAVVTYFPDAGFGERLSAMTREVGPLIVVDNTTEAAARDRVRVLCSALGCEFTALPGNLGLAVALNRAFAQLEERGLTWAIAFDQDSTPAAGFGATLLAAASPTDGNAPPVVIGANWVDIARPDFPSRHLRRHPVFPLLFQRAVAGEDLEGVTCVITSGSLIHLPTWRRLGGFDADLFLDLVDTDYCLRAAQSGGAIHVSARAHLQHQRGAKRPVRFLGRTWWPAFMPPRRLQGLFRNRLRLFRRHAWRAPHWMLFEIMFAAKIVTEIIFLEDQKFAKLAACTRGTWEGLLGRRRPL